MTVHDIQKHRWAPFSASEIARTVAENVEVIIGERDEEIADLRRQVKYLEARLAVEKTTRKESPSVAFRHMHSEGEVG